MNEQYIKRCQKKLKEWNAPLEDWFCVGVIDFVDEAEDYTICELCGCEKVRFVHQMAHNDYFEEVNVGCICAGIMEGDLLVAKDREREMKNRAARRRNFPKKNWKTARTGSKYLTNKGTRVFINERCGRYTCNCNGVLINKYKGKPITDFLSACYAAFDEVDPLEEILC